MSLASRVVVITGGSRGIGRALAVACAERGAHVVTCARRFTDDAPGVTQVVADVRVAADLACVVAAARALASGGGAGAIDVLVNNAALAGGDFADVLATNVIAADECARAVLATNPRARIVNVSSGVVALARADASAYIASKHALEGVGRALQCDAPDATIVNVQLGAHRAGVNIDRADAAPVQAAVAALLDAMTADGLRGRTIEAWRRPSASAAPTADADLLAHPLGAPRGALAALAACADLHRYPAADELVKLVAAEHRVPLDRIAIGAGASELLARILRATLRAGERLIAHDPSWPLFPSLCNAHGAVATTVPYRLRDGRVDHDLERIAAIARADRGARMIYLISPSNPMGCALDAAPFARFLAALPADVAIVVDEAYGEFVTRADAARAIDAARTDPRVIAVRTFSKFYGLAGARIGYAIASPARVRELAAVALPFSVGAPAIAAAIGALGDREHARATHALVAAGRAAHPDALPSDAPFALVAGAGTYFDRAYGMVPLWRQ